jgi:hypothetical protein
MLLREIRVEQRRRGRAQHAPVAGVTNSSGRWICHEASVSFSVVIFMKNAIVEGRGKVFPVLN